MQGERGFAGSARADDGDSLTFVDGQVYAIEGAGLVGKILIVNVTDARRFYDGRCRKAGA